MHKWIFNKNSTFTRDKVQKLKERSWVNDRKGYQPLSEATNDEHQEEFMNLNAHVDVYILL